jgi:hypothetical protein
VQGWLHTVGAILFPAGVAAVLLKGPSLEAARLQARCSFRFGPPVTI